MESKNDCERDYIKEAFDKLYNCVMPYIDLKQFADADTAFKELDKKVHSEIYILKKCLSERDKAVDAGLTRSEVDRERISDLEEQLAQENRRLKLLENSRTGWRSRAQHAEKRVMDLNKRISELEEENANLRVTPFDTLEALKKENSDLENELTKAKRLEEIYHRSANDMDEENDRLREVIDGKEKEINSLKKTIHELEKENASLRVPPTLAQTESDKRPWHGDANAMTGGRTCCESLTEAIEFQNKKIEELEAEKTRLKEAYDIQETTIKRLKLLLGKEYKENVDLSYGHEFEFGDEVFVPWSDGPYMYVKCGMMYNPRTERLVYVGKDQHLKWFGYKFVIK